MVKNSGLNGKSVVQRHIFFDNEEKHCRSGGKQILKKTGTAAPTDGRSEKKTSTAAPTGGRSGKKKTHMKQAVKKKKKQTSILITIFLNKTLNRFLKNYYLKINQKNILNLKCSLHVDNIITDLNTSLNEIIPFSNN